MRSVDKDTIFEAANSCFQAILRTSSSVQELRGQLENIKETLSLGSSCGLCGAIDKFSLRLQSQDLQAFTEADAEAKVERTIQHFSDAVRKQRQNSPPAAAAASTIADRARDEEHSKSIKELFGNDNSDDALFDNDTVASNKKQATSTQSHGLFCDDGDQFTDSLHNRLFKPSPVRKVSAARDEVSQSRTQALFAAPCALSDFQLLDQTKRDDDDAFKDVPLKDGSVAPSGSARTIFEVRLILALKEKSYSFA